MKCKLNFFSTFYLNVSPSSSSSSSLITSSIHADSPVLLASSLTPPKKKRIKKNKIPVINDSIIVIRFVFSFFIQLSYLNFFFVSCSLPWNYIIPFYSIHSFTIDVTNNNNDNNYNPHKFIPCSMFIFIDLNNEKKRRFFFFLVILSSPHTHTHTHEERIWEFEMAFYSIKVIKKNQIE